jgi:anthranilate phosphoribosyltransferase
MENLEGKLLNKLIEHYSLSVEESYSLMELFLHGDFNPKLAASILSIITFKGEHPDEVTGFAKAMIDEMKKFNSPYDNLMDIVGTGGDKKKAFNISTIACLILSSLEIKIAKQTRRSAASGCGSADILEALGIRINADYEQKKLCLDQENIVLIDFNDYCTVCGPIHEVQNELGFSSILYLLPPLCHPARVKRIIVGTPDRFKASLVARTLENTGIEKAYVLWNEAGYDEIVPIGTTRVLVVEKGKEHRELFLTANDFGLAGNYKVGTPIRGGSLELNMKAFDEIDSCTPGIAFDTVIMNAALGLRLTGRTNSLKEGAELVKTSFKKGMLKQKVSSLAKITNSI